MKHIIGMKLGQQRARFAHELDDEEFALLAQTGMPVGWWAWHFNAGEHIGNNERARAVAALPVVMVESPVFGLYEVKPLDYMRLIGVHPHVMPDTLVKRGYKFHVYIDDGDWDGTGDEENREVRWRCEVYRYPEPMPLHFNPLVYLTEHYETEALALADAMQWATRTVQRHISEELNREPVAALKTW